MKTMIVLGNDKVGGAALEKIKNFQDIIIYIDRTTTFKRILRLIKNGTISLSLCFRMFLCEIRRDGKKPSSDIRGIYSNDDLSHIIREKKPSRIILFRAGLIVRKDVIKTGINILNVHAAKVPDYGGIGSIDRALKDKAYEQNASLHVITTRIDEGEVIDKEFFSLNPAVSYLENETIAYNAAILLLIRCIRRK